MTPDTDACFYCEGVQSEGFLCHQCGLVADGRGNMNRAKVEGPDLTELAKSIMENGGRWAGGMAWVRTSSGGQTLSSQQGRHNDGDDDPPGVLPGLSDGPTCRALWDQLRAKLSDIGLIMMIERGQYWVTFSAMKLGGPCWHVVFSGPEPEALAAAFKWLAGARNG